MEEVEEYGSARKKPRFSNNREIDEDLHSAQLAVYGRETMMKLLDSKVLISGMQGLGVEIAKNIILAGVKSVTLHDENEVELWDLASSFVYSEVDVGRNRALASLHKLKELNNDVAVSTLTGKLTKEQLSGFKAVVFVDTSFERATEFDDYCHNQNPPIAFIKADVRGLFGSLFCDFGPHFTVLDVDGEKPHSAIIASVSNGNHASVSCVNDGVSLGFQDRDFVVFSEVEGMTELNDGKPRKINNVKPHSFVLDEDTTSFGKYVKGGIVTQVKQPMVLNFKPLREAIKYPGDFLHSDVSKSDRPPLLHLAFQALDIFLSKVGRFPSSGSEEDSQKLLSIATDINENSVGSRLEDVDSNVLRHLAFGSRAVLNPMAAMFGGIVGQEVVKACSGKFHPIFQFFYFDSLESLPKEPLDPLEFRPQNSRYDAQISVFGSTLQKKLENARVFVVGAGAHGCEFLKNLALMGVSCGDQGKLTVTDDDVIQKSNLGHQFLFRDWNIGRAKSTVAAAAAGINSRLKIDALQNRVEPETENVFCDSFWQNLTVVVNGLDNVTQRPYVESRCSQFKKRLLNTQMDKLKANFGRIIPAFATSTAIATGFVCLELYKVVDVEIPPKSEVFNVLDSARSKNQLKRTNELQQIIDDWLSKRYTILRSSWSEINADAIAEPFTQVIDNCWCVALRRQWYAAMRLAKHEISESDLPSLETMMDGVGNRIGLADWASVVAYMKQQPHVENMVVHYNTEPFSEDFENLLMRLLDTDGPLAVGMTCHPSYDDSNFQGVVEPNKFERDSMVYHQCIRGHVSLLTGRGIDTRSKKPYLELSDSNGFRTGECGIIRLARHLGLIHFAVELKVKPRF